MTEQELLAMAQYGPTGMPMLFDGPPNLYQPQPMQQPMQQPAPQPMAGPVTPVMNPNYAMMDQAMMNLGNLRQGKPATQSPTQAYTQQVAFNTQLRLQQEQEKRAKELMRMRDPYYEYEEGKRRGILPEEMTWAEFQQARYKHGSGTSVMQNFAEWKRLNPKKPDETDEEYAERARSAFNTLARAPSVGSGPGASRYVYDPVSGQYQYLESPERGTQLEETLAGATKGAEKWATLNADWDVAQATAGPQLQQSIGLVREMIDLIDSNPDMPTGLLQGRITPMTNEVVSFLETNAMLLAIPRLQEAKLNPVTELELKKIQDTFANALKDPRANRASLVASLRDMIRIAQRYNNINQYYNEKGTLKGFGSAYNIDIPELPAAPGNQRPGDKYLE